MKIIIQILNHKLKKVNSVRMATGWDTCLWAILPQFAPNCWLMWLQVWQILDRLGFIRYSGFPHSSRQPDNIPLKFKQLQIVMSQNINTEVVLKHNLGLHIMHDVLSGITACKLMLTETCNDFFRATGQRSKPQGLVTANLDHFSTMSREHFYLR